MTTTLAVNCGTEVAAVKSMMTRMLQSMVQVDAEKLQAVIEHMGTVAYAVADKAVLQQTFTMVKAIHGVELFFPHKLETVAFKRADGQWQMREAPVVPQPALVSESLELIETVTGYTAIITNAANFNRDWLWLGLCTAIDQCRVNAQALAA